MEVPNNQENMAKCICGSCPTYLEGDTGFFCSLDKSDKNPEQKGCYCNDCALWGQYDLSDGYFCINGKAS